LPMAAEKREKVAKVSKGKVVRNPARPLDSPISSLITGISGPTAVMDGRRLKDTSKIPKISQWLLVLSFKLLKTRLKVI